MSDPGFDQDAWDEVCKQFLDDYDAQVLKMIDTGSIPALKANEDSEIKEDETGAADSS